MIRALSDSHQPINSSFLLDMNIILLVILGEFIADVNLVFSNCLTYNMPRSVHAKAAVHLGSYFEKRMKETGLDKYKDLVEPGPPTKRRKS